MILNPGEGLPGPREGAGPFGPVWDQLSTSDLAQGTHSCRGVRRAAEGASLSFGVTGDVLEEVMAEQGLEGKGHLPAKGAARPV